MADKQLHMYVDDGGVETVIAYSPEDASAVVCELQGCSMEDLEDVEWAMRDDDEMVQYCSDSAFDDKDIPPGRECTVTPEHFIWAWCVVATAKEWIEHCGRSYFSTTEY